MKPFIEQKLKELLQFAKEHALAEVSWQEGDKKIFFRRDMSKVTVSDSVNEAEPAPLVVETDNIVRSPIVGTFRRADSKNHPPFVMEGNHIKPGDRVGLVECMKIPTVVTSFCEGMIKEIVVEDGQAVEYGQPLFIVRPGDTNGVNHV